MRSRRLIPFAVYRNLTGNIIQTDTTSYEIYLTSKYATKPPTLDKTGKSNTIDTMIQLAQ